MFHIHPCNPCIYINIFIDIEKFIEDLPNNLKNDLNMFIYEKIYARIEFLKEKKE
jgi:hypothetical protein